ncbi:MAG: glyoxalase superfamily protein [Pseudomonadota bacterium]
MNAPKDLFKSPIPIFRSFDEALARSFYLHFLEFTLLFEHRFDDAAPFYMGVQNGDFTLHLSEHFGDASPGSHIRVAVDDVSTLSQRLRNKAYKHARPGAPVRQPWGMLELSISDPFGNRLTFFQEITQSDT